MAVELGILLSWAGVNADCSWLIARSHDVVELWESSEIANTTKLSVTINWPENFFWMSILVSIMDGPTVASHEGPEYEEENDVGTFSIEEWAVFDFAVNLIVLTIIVFIIKGLVCRTTISHD